MVVVQADHFNFSRLGTVVVCPLTSNTDRAELPGNVFIPASASGLAKDSVANATQITTVDRASLTTEVARLPEYLLADLDTGLRVVLGLR